MPGEASKASRAPNSCRRGWLHRTWRGCCWNGHRNGRKNGRWEGRRRNTLCCHGRWSCAPPNEHNTPKANAAFSQWLWGVIIQKQSCWRSDYSEAKLLAECFSEAKPGTDPPTKSNLTQITA
eukprot:12970082-Alexandrium_andersonii.AAC.1